MTKTETPFALALRPILLISKLRWIYGNNELFPVIIENIGPEVTTNARAMRGSLVVTEGLYSNTHR